MTTHAAQWQPPCDRLRPTPGEIHVWRIGLDAPQWALASATILSPVELRRARRFAFECDALRFVRRRIALRRILARYTGLGAGDHCFICEPSGKPCLAPLDSARTITFSMTHSHGLALVAVSNARTVGIDVEMMRPLDAMTTIAAQFLSKREQSALINLPANQQTLAFFNGWTRKEALLKALGVGLLPALKRFEVSLKPHQSAQVLSVDGDEMAAARWSLTTLQPAPGYTAAVAVESTHPRMVFWEYSVKDDYSHADGGMGHCP